MASREAARTAAVPPWARCSLRSGSIPSSHRNESGPRPAPKRWPRSAGTPCSPQIPDSVAAFPGPCRELLSRSLALCGPLRKIFLRSSHGLPDRNSWEYLIADIRSNLLIYLVGAAGFEPTTCSTQNCRATRLRYTPICWEVTSIPRLNRSPQGAKPASSAAVEQRMGHPVAGRDPVFLRRAGNHLQHALGEPARRDDFGRQRLGILRDPQDAAVGADKDHVERDVGVLHPHRDLLLRRKIEQHAFAVGQLFPVHQPGFLRLLAVACKRN